MDWVPDVIAPHVAAVLQFLKTTEPEYVPVKSSHKVAFVNPEKSLPETD